jgi:hypothetical protein
MRKFFLGHIRDSKKRFYFPTSALNTHVHLIGGTGKGKTTAINRILHALLMDPVNEPCIVIIDRLGGLSFDLLLWMASDFCTDDVRKRLVYVEPARENVVMGFNPLLFETESDAFYRVSRAAELILRGWASQNLGEMPRLARWLYNSFIAGAVLGLTISDTEHFLLPGSTLHRRLLDCLPPRLKCEWSELTAGRSAEVLRILDSTRNRLNPYFASPVLRRMFGATQNRLDIRRFMREGKILLLNLAPGGRIPEQVADAIGGLVINEILSTARSQPIGVRYPTYLFLDEFQRFVSGDMEAAIPEVRQLGIRLILSHQSLDQLRRGDNDLTTLIFQCQTRLIFGLQGEDADVLAHELASIEFNPYKIKQELYARRQRIVGHRMELLSSWQEGATDTQGWMRQNGQGWGAGKTIHHGRILLPTYDESTNQSHNNTEGTSGSRGNSYSTGTHEQLVAVHEDFLELVSRTYTTFEEDKHVRARDIRIASRGRAFIRLVDQPHLYEVDIKRSAPGHLAWDAEKLAVEFPEALDEVEQLIQENFKQDCFVTPEVIEQETQERLNRVLRIGGNVTNAKLPIERQPSPDADPFA